MKSLLFHSMNFSTYVMTCWIAESLMAILLAMVVVAVSAAQWEAKRCER